MDQPWLWAGFTAVRARRARARPRRLQPQGARGHDARGRGVEPRLGLARDRVRRRHRPASWAGRPRWSSAAGYLVEEALSVDNLFVFILIFGYFKVARRAAAPRAVLGHPRRAGHARRDDRAPARCSSQRFHWIIYVFGAFLRVHRHAAWRSAAGTATSSRSTTRCIRLVRRMLPVTRGLPRPALLRARGRRVRTDRCAGSATPLFVVLVLVETTDLVFAVDSIPAIFGVTRDPFLVYTSNVFAILGLRSLYFLLAGVIEQLPPAPLRARGGAGVRRREDAARRHLSDPDRRVARRHRRCCSVDRSSRRC